MTTVTQDYNAILTFNHNIKNYKFWHNASFQLQGFNYVTSDKVKKIFISFFLSGYQSCNLLAKDFLGVNWILAKQSSWFMSIHLKSCSTISRWNYPRIIMMITMTSSLFVKMMKLFRQKRACYVCTAKFADKFLMTFSQRREIWIFSHFRTSAKAAWKM